MDVKDLIAPTVEKRKETAQKLKDVSYYLIIGIISILIMFVVPVLTGCLYGDIGLAFPSDLEGWILWSIIKVGTAIANVSLFVLFKLQAKVNVKGEAKYIEANSKLANVAVLSKSAWKPKSPKEMDRKEYLCRGTCIFLTSLVTSITIASLIISFDFITFLSCIISTVISIIMGWMTMLKNEVYWVDEYPMWVDWKLKQVSELSEGEKKECLNLETQNSEICKNKSQETNAILNSLNQES